MLAVESRYYSIQVPLIYRTSVGDLDDSNCFFFIFFGEPVGMVGIAW